MRRRAATAGSRYERWTRALSLYLLAPALFLLTLPGALDLARGPYLGMAVRNLTIANVDPGGPAAQAGLRARDGIIEVNGRQPRTMVDHYVLVAAQPRFSPQQYLVRRDGALLNAVVVPTPPPQSVVVWRANLYLAGLAFLLMGWWVLRRRDDMVGRAFFGLCFIFALVLMELPRSSSAVWVTSTETTRDLLILLLPPVFLRFFLYFPSVGHLPPQRKRRHRLLLLPVAPLFAGSLYAQAAQLDPQQAPLVAALQGATILYFSGYVIAALAIFARKVLRRDRPLQHTKLRVVLLGLCAGLGPFLLAGLLSNLLPPPAAPQLKWLGFSLVLVPLSFGLAILRYGALDTGFVIRHGLTYGGLTLLVALIYFVSAGLLGHLLTSRFGVSTYPLALATVILAALLILPARRALQRWIDRAFYPARGATRAAVEAVGRELTGLIDSTDAARTLALRLQELYAPRRLSLLLADGREDLLVETVALSEGEAQTPVFRLPLDSSLSRLLFAARRPLFLEEIEDVGGADEIDAESRVLIERLGCELLVPLITGNRLTGVLACGPRRDGSLYTQDDLANLRVLAVQAAAQLESTRLYQQSLSQRLLASELALAQEIQARLLPTSALEQPGVRLCGRMESCREVGGDYYDYFPLDESTIGFAIADVAGKGVPAALLMSSLRAAFRAEAARERLPERVVARLNEAICGELGSGQLVSFFYGVYAPAEGRLLYCNAGMNPPLLFRGRRPWMEQLRLGGPLLGAGAALRYRRGTLLLDPGDRLLLFTDGLTEEIDEAGDFFDLERLLASARANLARPLEDLREAVFAAVDAFGGSQRADDRTLVLLEVQSR